MDTADWENMTTFAAGFHTGSTRYQTDYQREYMNDAAVDNA